MLMKEVKFSEIWDLIVKPMLEKRLSGNNQLYATTAQTTNPKPAAMWNLGIIP